jgi:uncharacterized protein YcsI (UPF0317 family)
LNNLLGRRLGRTESGDPGGDVHTDPGSATPVEARALFRDGLRTPTARRRLPRRTPRRLDAARRAGARRTAVRVTARYPAVHGAPVHVVDPAALGLTDLDRPDFGDPVDIRDGEVPVFWACGVTPQAAVMASRPPLAICHAPGHMAITDARDTDLVTP